MPSSPSLFPGLLGDNIFVYTPILTELWGIWANISPLPAWARSLLSFTSQGILKFIGLITKVMINKIGLQLDDSEGPARTWSIVAYINKISFLIFVFLVLWHLLIHCLGRDCPSQGWQVLAMAKDLPETGLSSANSPIQSPSSKLSLLSGSYTLGGDIPLSCLSMIRHWITREP